MSGGLFLFFVLLVLAGLVVAALKIKPADVPEAQIVSDPDTGLENKAGLTSGQGVPLGFKIEYVPEGYYESDGSGPFYGRPHLDIPLSYNGDRHLVTFGPTGSGKNATSQTPVLLEYDASALAIDVKGQLCAITAYQRFYLGHKVAVLNPFDVLGIPSATYNPLSHLNPAAPSFASDCRRIAEGMVDLPKKDHWELSALDVVDLLIMWTKLYEDDKSLVRLRQLLNLPADQRIAFFENMVIESADKHPILAEGAARYTSDAPEVRDCIQHAVVQLGFLRDPAIAKILQGGPNEISFAELKRSKMTAYFILPPELLHTHGKFLRLMVLAALGELIREPAQPEKPVLFILDEFAALGHMSMIENAAAIVRDYKIRLWIILQNIPQLKALYGNRWESFLSSAGVIQAFAPNDLETAEYVSKRSGIKIINRLSESFSTSSNYGTTATGTTSGTSASRSTNFTQTEVPNFSVQDLFELHPNGQLLICAGIREAVLAYRLQYWHQPELAFLHHNDPYHMDTAARAEFETLTRSGRWLDPKSIEWVLDKNIELKAKWDADRWLPDLEAFFALYAKKGYSFEHRRKNTLMRLPVGSTLTFTEDNALLQWGRDHFFRERSAELRAKQKFSPPRIYLK